MPLRSTYPGEVTCIGLAASYSKNHLTAQMVHPSAPDTAPSSMMAPLHVCLYISITSQGRRIPIVLVLLVCRSKQKYGFPIFLCCDRGFINKFVTSLLRVLTLITYVALLDYCDKLFTPAYKNTTTSQRSRTIVYLSNIHPRTQIFIVFNILVT